MAILIAVRPSARPFFRERGPSRGSATAITARSAPRDILSTNESSNDLSS